MGGMELLNLSMWLLTFQHREMHPKAVGFTAVDVVDFFPTCPRAPGAGSVQWLWGGFTAKHHHPVPESRGKGPLQTGSTRLRERLIYRS